MKIVEQGGKHYVLTHFRNLFGDDIDGVCIMFGFGFPQVLQRTSPSHFAPSIPAVATAMWDDRPSGLDSDTLYTYIYPVKGSSVVGRYKLVFRSALDVVRPSGEPDRCYEPDAPVGVQSYTWETGVPALLIDLVPGKSELPVRDLVPGKPVQ